MNKPTLLDADKSVVFALLGGGKNVFNKNVFSVEQFEGLSDLIIQFGKETLAETSVSKKRKEDHLSQINYELKRNKCFFTIPVVSSEPAGYILCYFNYPLERFKNQSCFYISEEYILPKFRGTGLYADILKITLAESKKTSHKTTYKEVHIGNKLAFNASLKTGFKEVKKACPEKGNCYSVMSKRIC